MSKEELQHLKWIYERMVNVHGENPKVDYMQKFRQILNKEDASTEVYDLKKQIKALEDYKWMYEDLCK